MLSIKDLCQHANISQQTFYRLTRENKEFRTLVETKREKKGNGYRYDTAVLDWLYSYYDREDTSIPAVEVPEGPSEADLLLDEVKSLSEQLRALQGEYEALEAKYQSSEKERQMLLLQNNQLLCLLSQEKQEKQALLPQPRKPLMEKIKSLFKAPLPQKDE